MAVKPLDVVYKNITNRVIVKLKGGREYHGTLDGFDVWFTQQVVKL